MKKIKFRGLRTDGKGWVYGMLFHNNKIVTETVSYESPLVEKGSPCYKYEYINIIPESVGQFTGLHDKNGKEIYEGDIVSYKRNVGNWTGKSLTTIHEIIFTEEINAFVMKDNSSYIKLRKHWGYEYEVIGNIHEKNKL